MRHLAHLGAGWEDMREVPFPLRWVRSLPKPAHGRGVEYRLDTAADPARGFGLLGPDRIEHLHDKARIDHCDGQFPQCRVRVGRQRVAPLLAVLGVAPARFIAGDEFLRDFVERPPLRRGKLLRLSLGFLRVERVPSWRCFRCSVAFARASASEISG